jgi:stage II sporulation protein D
MGGRRGVIALAAVLAAGFAAGRSAAATELVVTGRGWGHGVGMSQWGAYGYARHGWSWQQILEHYYPGTQLGSTPNVRVRVLLAAGRPSLDVGCPGGFRVADATGRAFALRPGARRVGPGLKLRLAHRVAALESPLAFYCDAAPIEWDGRAYHGVLVVQSRGARMAVVDATDLEDYVRGVVGGEMPRRWSLPALEAQAVAARSYALAMLRPGKLFDLYADTRSQMYGGVGFESARTDLAVAQTTGRILTWSGHVATTYFFSTSGGRTADVREVWPRLGAVPYLRSVADPYDAASPRHLWGPRALSAQQIAARLHVAVGPIHLVRTQSGRVASVEIGSSTVSGVRFQRAFGLDSTWFDVGTISLSGLGDEVVYGGKIALVAHAKKVGQALLQHFTVHGWSTVKVVRGDAHVVVEPRAYAMYRLTVAGVRGPEIAVSVAPVVRVSALAADVLAGSVAPRSRGAVTVWRSVGGAWSVVARPRLDAKGAFETQLRLRPGAYRIGVDADGAYAAASRTLHMTPRLLASLRR